MQGIQILDRIQAFGPAMAIIDERGTYTYEQLDRDSRQGAAGLLKGEADLDEARVAFLVDPGYDYVVSQWSIWRAGGVAVPLSVHHPLPELEYVLEDTGAQFIIVDEAHEDVFATSSIAKNRTILTTESLGNLEEQALPSVASSRRAMILYTSGTTSKPKGVVSTHDNVTSQITCLIDAWGWTAKDEILHVLPLHHTHGIINVLLCAMWAGATCRMHHGFNAERVWNAIEAHPLTLFMAVPTIYTRLIKYWEEATEAQKKSWSAACEKLRLMVSGSAALPVSVLEQWRRISGHTLLERYGMTEIGMALSNPLIGERRPGSVGRPLPGVALRLVDESGNEIKEGLSSGEIQIQGPNVFLEYWNKPEATTAAFKDGWFCTGDTAVLENQYYRILGRNSVDIIKTGGYKVSALEIEEVLRTHPAIRACAVVGVADPDWGERVCAGIVCNTSATLTLDALRSWAKERLAPYKIPSRLQILTELPRNVLGKVTKPAVKQLFDENAS